LPRWTEEGCTVDSTTTVPKPGILIVDDDPSVRMLLEQCLRDSGFPTWQAGDGLAALAVFDSHRDEIEVILLDVEMPVLDEPQTLAALRRRDPLVRCCFMSGNPISLEGLAAHDIAGSFHKPFDLRQVADRLRRIAERWPHLS
jgi:CheY-like chemotaxis protein